MRLPSATALIALVGSTTLVASAPSATTPITVVLTSETPTSMPAPGRPRARVVLTISQPRGRKDGYLVSTVRVRRLELPEHRSYFFRADFGPYFKYLCEAPRCAGDVPWVYSRQKLHALRTFGVVIEVFISGGRAQSGRISSVAGGRIEAEAFAPAPRRRSAARTAAGPSARRAPRPDHRLEADGSKSFDETLLAVVALTVVFGLGHARAEMLAPASPLGTDVQPEIDIAAAECRRAAATCQPVGERRVLGRAAPAVETRGKDQSAADTRRHHGARHVRPHPPRKAGQKRLHCLPSPRVVPAQSHSADGELHLAGRYLLPDLLAGPTYIDVHTKANPRGELRGQITVERIS